MRKRNHIIPLHLNKKELAHLEAQVKLSGLAREEFLRSLIMGAQLQARPCTHHGFFRTAIESKIALLFAENKKAPRSPWGEPTGFGGERCV